MISIWTCYVLFSFFPIEITFPEYEEMENDEKGYNITDMLQISGDISPLMLLSRFLLPYHTSCQTQMQVDNLKLKF